MTVLPPVLVPRNPQQITGPRYEPTRYANNQSQSVYSPQSEGSPLTFDYPGMIHAIVFQEGINVYVCMLCGKRSFTRGDLQELITNLESCLHARVHGS